MTADRLAVARRAATAAGSVAAEGFRSDLAVEYKTGKTDTVTRADREAQRRAIEVIHDAFPGEAIVGEEEEAASELPDDGTVWIIDPIDGTNNYVRGVQIWATAIAAVVDGQVEAAVTHLPALGDTIVSGSRRSTTERNETSVAVSDRRDPEACHVGLLLWWALDDRDRYAAACREAVHRFADIRRIGSAQTALANVATGALDGGFTTVTGPVWDTVAGVNHIRRAGGRVTDLHGNRWHPTAEGLVASNDELHDAVLAAAQTAV